MIATAIAVISFSISIVIKSLRTPKNVIGQADTMTSIQVEGAAIDPMIFFVLFGIAALIVAITLTVRYICKK